MNIFIKLILLLFVVGILFGYQYNNVFRIKGLNYNTVILSIFTIILTLMNGFRSSRLALCSDYSNYVYEYNLCNRLSVTEAVTLLKREPIYFLLEKAIYKITNGNVIALMIVVAFLTIFFLTLYFSSYSEIPWISLLLLITIGSYWTSFNTMRNYLAIALLTISYKYIINRQPARFFTIVLIATLIHRSMFFYLPFYFILNTNWGSIREEKNNTIKFLIIAISTFIAPVLLTFVLKNYYGVATLAYSRATLLNAVRPTIILIFGILTIHYVNWENIQDRVSFNSLIYFSLLGLLSLRAEAFIRLSYIFVPGMLCHVTNMIVNNSSKSKFQYAISLIGFSLLYGFMTLYRYEYFPYWYTA